MASRSNLMLWGVGLGVVALVALASGGGRSTSPTPAPGPGPGPLPPRTPEQPTRGPWRFSAASLRRFQGVHPEIVAVATRALETSPLDFAVTSGLRTTEEQQRLFDGGFSDCNPSAGCVGKHTMGRALDLAPIFDGKVELHSKERVRQLGPIVKAAAAELGIPVKWLGDSTDFDDPFHWELTSATGAPSLAGYRRVLEQSEVTPYMTEQAIAALPQPLGDIRGPFVNERGELFKIKLEVHGNAPKGASAFIRETPVA